ncbi:hypothetical protein QF028_006329 [Neobacillus sp. B4I6]
MLRPITLIRIHIIKGEIAGLMIYPEELLPAAMRNDEGKLSIYGLIGSMAVMALSLLLFI